MMLREKDAKAKWCPFSRIAVTSDGDGLFTSMPDVKRWECIASRCMAWRWESDRKQLHDSTEPMDTGYCGLAGKP